MQEIIYEHLRDIERRFEDDTRKTQINNGVQTDDLTDLLEYARKNTEFYANIEKADIRLFPVVNKSILKDNNDSVFVKSYADKKTVIKKTSGSTGTPFAVAHCMDKWYRHVADLKYFGELAGYRDHDSLCYFRAMPTASEEAQKKDNIWQVDICDLSEENLTKYYHFMIEKKCTALLAYASSLETAVNFWIKKFPENKLFVKSVICISETLTDEVRAKLESYFGKDAQIRARYSNTENGILGQEIGVSGSYALNWASYYFEILKMDSDEPAEEGELGRIVVTDLYNRAFPMIRYDTGDVAKMGRADGEYPYFYELFGRRMDLIRTSDGGVVSPFLISQTFKCAKGVAQWQFIQKTLKDYVIKVVVADGFAKPTFDSEIADFKKILGDDINIVIEYVDEVPVLNSLKRKLIISEL